MDAAAAAEVAAAVVARLAGAALRARNSYCWQAGVGRKIAELKFNDDANDVLTLTYVGGLVVVML